jgi:hypothetical protein
LNFLPACDNFCLLATKIYKIITLDPAVAGGAPSTATASGRPRPARTSSNRLIRYRQIRPPLDMVRSFFSSSYMDHRRAHGKG